MRGQTHYKVGILYYILFCIIPLAIAFPLLNPQFTYPGILAAALGALLPDIDSKNSEINQLNPALKGGLAIIDGVGNLLSRIIGLTFSIGLGVLTFYYRTEFISFLSGFDSLKPYASIIAYGIGILFILMGIIGQDVMLKIPVIGMILRGIKNSSRYLKGIYDNVLYGGIGIGILYYSFTHHEEPVFYVLGLLFIIVATFPHRSFLHSPEGLILFTYAASKLFHRFGYSHLTAPFFIGYFSHLYLSDIFTPQGVPISSLPIVFKKIGIDRLFRKNHFYRWLKRVLSSDLKIPLVSSDKKTDSESKYVFFLLCSVIGVFVLFTI